MTEENISLQISETEKKIKEAKERILELCPNSYACIDAKTTLILLEGKLSRLLLKRGALLQGSGQKTSACLR
jgi:hypothetical protein